jgi:uncharacterized protein (DUF1697 family)
MGVHIALLRGINIGGNNKVPMKDLATIFTTAKCTDVRTYIQSGNVVFKTSDTAAKRVGPLIVKALADRFGFDIPVVMRTADEMQQATQNNPFFKKGADIDRLYVAFLADEPTPDQIAALDVKRSPPDEFVVVGREIYLRFPNGAGRTKLTNAYFDSKLKTISTIRNWRTVTTLKEMAEQD